MTRLDEEGRVAELGRMLGGASVSRRLRASAREMLAERAGSAALARRREGAKGETKSKGESESPKATDVKKTRQRRGAV